MNFQIPQFIEIEDKIFGPLTFKQFIYVAGSAGLAFIVYTLLPSIYLSIIPIIAIIGFGLALAFYQINNRPFIFALQAYLRYLINHKLYIWKKSTELKPNKPEPIPTEQLTSLPRLSNSRLKELAWSLDVKEHIK